MILKVIFYYPKINFFVKKLIYEKEKSININNMIVILIDEKITFH